MVFSSILFIFYFLSALLLIYFLIPKKYRNIVLLVFSLLFYFLGEPKNIIFLLISCLFNYYLSLSIYKNKDNVRRKKSLLIIGISYNILQLVYFKYTNFFLETINEIFKTHLVVFKIILPIGISFYTFQALAYLIDIYKERHKPAKTLLDFMTYLTLFAQLIAGPIVRFKDIENDLKEKKFQLVEFANGIKRFIIGLGKKVLLANVLGELILKLTGTSVLASWMKPFCYTLQIYFDFSGYSDMAIGLGLLFGFHFLENFNYPLIAKSITDFWKRWHISLSSWFRDYVYIPLGGNRVSTKKWLRNILIVWLLTGLWHGASWNFIFWGLYFGLILIIEKLFLTKYLLKRKIINHIYTFLVIIISFLLFSNTDINIIVRELKNMFFLNKLPLIDKVTLFYIKDYFCLIIIAIIGATPLIKKINKKLLESKYANLSYIIEPISLILIFLISIAFLVDQSFNPFLYFRF